MNIMANRPTSRSKITADSLLSAAKKGNVSPVYLITGSDEVCREQFFQKLISQIIIESVRDFNLNLFSAENLDCFSFKSCYESYPVMSKMRVLILRDCDKLKQAHRDCLETILVTPVETSCIVMVSEKVDHRLKLFKEVSKMGSTISFLPPYDKNIPKWIETQASSMGLKFDPNAILLLQRYVGNSPGELLMEIEKLAACVSEKLIISEELVNKVVAKSRVATVFELADAIGEQNIVKALNLLQNFLDGGNHPSIAVKMIVRHYSILSLAMIELGKGNSVEKIAQVVGVHPFFASSYIHQARSFTHTEILQCLSIVKDADWQVRSLGKRLERIAMDQMVVRLCSESNL